MPLSLPAVGVTVQAGREGRQATTRRLLAYYSASRALTVLAMWLATVVHPGLTMAHLVGQWDGGWYLKIMAHGYPASIPSGGGSSIVFFPLYPFIARGAAWVLPVADVWAAACASLVFGGLAVLLVHRLAEMVTDRETATRAAIFFAFFPGSFVLSMIYTQGLLIVLAAACLMALMRGRWVAAGLLAALATACHPTGLALCVACGWQALVAIRLRREWRSLVAPLLAPMGVVTYFGYLWIHTGEATAWFTAQREGWAMRPRIGQPTRDLVVSFVRHPFGSIDVAIAVVTLSFAVMAFVFLLRSRWPSVLTAYTLALLLLPILSRGDSLRPRDVITAFPLLIATAGRVRGDSFRRLLACSTAGLLGLLLGHVLQTLGAP